MSSQFPKNPPPRLDTTTLVQLWSEIGKALDAMAPIIIRDVYVNTTQTEIAHGQRTPPQLLIPVPHSDTKACRSQVSDDKLAYYKSNIAGYYDFLVIP
jgi:hypothetical protein